MSNFEKGYCYDSLNQHVVYADWVDKDKGETLIYYDGKPLEKLPKDFVCDLKLYKSDLYVIYQRVVLKVKNIYKNDIPDEEYAISMQDYYSYEIPQLFDYQNEKLYISIGGRFFGLDEKLGRWNELAQFFIGEFKPLILDDGRFVFSTNLQKDNDLEGVKIYDPVKNELEFFPINDVGKSPNPKVFLDYI